ncbi:hypothetical protein [Terriglobus roseus]|uniref:Phage tail tube protein, GTA-gp10 n=1 Tax=Terriglobus roseus TaxID=392734 RepID=A0A1H4J355_9BACT|nr:hypothetical protein [Terriglobus roseus]SEB40673.1 hypothetical protein SAMN05443244_0324 [Terriglobus roseus]
MKFQASVGSTRPDVFLEIAGKERQLAFDLNAIAHVEKLTGLNLFREALAAEVMSATTLRALLFASLLPYDDTVTLEEVGSWVTWRNQRVIQQAVVAAWAESIPVVSDDAPGEAEAQAVQ